MQVHKSFFLNNPRLGMLVNSFDKMTTDKQQLHLYNAEQFFNKLVNHVLEWKILRKKTCHLKFALRASGLLPGEKNGKKYGKMLNTAAINAEK